VTAEDKELITKESEDTIKWIENNPNATYEELETKRKSLEEKFQPIMMKLYQQGGGMPGGMPGGGMPG